MLNRQLFLRGECGAELSSKEKSYSHAWENFGQYLESSQKALVRTQKLWIMPCVIKEFREHPKKFHISVFFLNVFNKGTISLQRFSNFSLLSLLYFSRTTRKETCAVIAFSVKCLDFLLFIFLLLNWFRENFKVVV